MSKYKQPEKNFHTKNTFFHTPEHFCARTHTMHAHMRTDTQQNGQNTMKQVANRYVKSEKVSEYSMGGVPFLQHGLAE